MTKYFCCGCMQIHDDYDFSPREGDVEIYTDKQEEFIKKVIAELESEVGK